MRRVLAALIAVASFCPAVASADPLRSPPCLAALDALTLAEQAASGRPPSPPGSAPEGAVPASVRAARQAAAAACLGTADVAPPPTRPRLPAAVDRTLLPAPLPDPARPAARTPAPVRQQPLHMITVCDAQGCWTTEGLRLPRQGSALLGPQGPCMQIGAVLNCP